jgi:hypothetical protein
LTATIRPREIPETVNLSPAVRDPRCHEAQRKQRIHLPECQRSEHGRRDN